MPSTPAHGLSAHDTGRAAPRRSVDDPQFLHFAAYELADCSDHGHIRQIEICVDPQAIHSGVGQQNAGDEATFLLFIGIHLQR